MINNTTYSNHLYCHRCKIVARKDIATEHCDYCDYCVEELDHHCPWSSKCIAKGNILYFKIFLSMTVVLTVYVFLAAMFYASA